MLKTIVNEENISTAEPNNVLIQFVSEILFSLKRFGLPHYIVALYVLVLLIYHITGLLKPLYTDFNSLYIHE